MTSHAVIAFSSLNDFIGELKNLNPKPNIHEVRTLVFNFIESLTSEDIAFCISKLALPSLEDDFCPRQISHHGDSDTQYAERQAKYTQHQMLCYYAIKIYES